MDAALREKLAKVIIEAINLEDVMDDIVAGIAEACTPEEIFGEAKLDEWAEENGWVKDH